jgi:phosphonate metabolism protein (transferase hexapeptide repeat family)
MTARLGVEPVVREGSTVVNSLLGPWTEIGEQNRLENVVMGDFSYSGPYCFFQNCVIRKFANIAAAVRVGPTRHPMDRPTLHHFTYRPAMYGMADEDEAAFFSWRESQVATVGNDTWIGHGAIIMPGVSVGDGAVVGSGSVVTRDLPPYSIAVGSPARAIKRRFPEEVAAALGRIAWWDWDREKIKENLELFRGSVEDFVRLHDPGAAR